MSLLHPIRSLVVAALAMGLAACASAPPAPDRAFDPTTGELRAIQTDALGMVRVQTLSVSLGVDERRAQYHIETPEGRSFSATVTQVLERDGDEEIIEVTDTQTGEVASWTFDDDVATQSNSEGGLAVVEWTDDGEQTQVTLPLADGSELLIDYTGVEEDSEEEEERTAVLALAMIGQAPLDGDQLEALAASAVAAEADLGATERGLGLKKLVQKVIKVLCKPVIETTCKIVTKAAQSYVKAPESEAMDVMFDLACTAVASQICK